MWTDDAIFRLVLSGLALAGLGLRITFQARAARLGGAVIQRADHPAFWIGVVVLMPFLLGPLIVYLIDPAALPWTKMPLPRVARWLGAGLTLATIGLIAWVFATLGENLTRTAGFRTHARLVTGGPYRWIRHPLYSFASLACLGTGVMLASWPVLLGVTALLPLLSLRAGREEAALIERFGDEYREYVQRTGRFFPRGRSA